MRNFRFVASLAFLTAWFAYGAEQPQLVPKKQCTERTTCITDLGAFIDTYDGLTEVELTATGAIPGAYDGEKDERVSPDEFADPLLRAKYFYHANCPIYSPDSAVYMASKCGQMAQERESLLRIYFNPFDVNGDGYIDRNDDPHLNSHAPKAAGDNMVTIEDIIPFTL